MGKALDGLEHHTGVRCYLHQAGVVMREIEGPPAPHRSSSQWSVSPLIRCVCVLVAQLCPNLGDPMDCSSPGSSVHRIFQVRVLE